MFKVKVRGIYSTALTRLLLDGGFRIVQPSAPIRERFKLPENAEDNSQPDMEIFDRSDKQGINVIGNAASVEKFISILFENLEDVVVRRYPSLYAFTSSAQEEAENQAGIMEVINETLKEAEALTPQRKVRVDIEFPGLSKRRLDEIRSMVVSTLDGHHYYKACGGKIAYMLEMAEKLLEKGCPKKEVEELFKEAIVREYPQEGSKINIEHVKVNGRVFHLGEARIIELDEQSARLKIVRTFSAPGVYDGLGVPKEPGDYAITSMIIGDLSFRTSYFSRSGEYKGTYVNINTPIEIYPSKIRYVDLEADICMWPDGRIQKIDFEKLDDIIRRGYASERLRKRVYEKIEEILNNLSPNVEKEVKYTLI